MVHPKPSSAAAASTTTTTAPNVASSNRRPPPRMNSGSFHAGAPFPSLNSYSETPMRSPRSHRRLPSSSQGYQTFPTAPPKTPRDAERTFDDLVASEDTASSSSDDEEDHTVTPLPLKQLALLALLSLAEQTALNSISPYLPTMVRNFSEIPESQTGLYVGLVASAFALAQLATNLVWGAMSDRIGRKPVLLLGTALLAGCFSVFGLCTKYWHVVLVQVAMGLLNGNAAVVPTCLGELTDRSNQSSAFTWLPVMYSIGSITGPALGGLLIPDDLSDSSYPFLYPNVVSAALLVFAVVVLSIWYEETLEEYDPNAEFPGLGWVRWLKERIGAAGPQECAMVAGAQGGRQGAMVKWQATTTVEKTLELKTLYCQITRPKTAVRSRLLWDHRAEAQTTPRTTTTPIRKCPYSASCSTTEQSWCSEHTWCFNFPTSLSTASTPSLRRRRVQLVGT
ncbi:hypothetical protein MCOR02_000084 [Pyricularia oryzae]|nr:hypothetical protein MCOR02_000084 [Pyricularia oryzae]